MNLIIWQQVNNISRALAEKVQHILEEKCFSHIKANEREFSVFGYVDNGQYFGGGWDGIHAENICGYSNVHIDNFFGWFAFLKLCGNGLKQSKQNAASYLLYLQITAQNISFCCVSDALFSV